MSYTKHNGMILAMDVLGVRNLNIKETCCIAEKIESAKSGIHDDIKLLDSIQKTPELSFLCTSGIVNNCYFLGDSFFLCFEPEKYIDLKSDLAKAQLFGDEVGRLASFFVEMLCRGLPVRGAIAFGEYIVSDDGRTLLGPAITDAVNWFEVADWIGLIATPSCGLLFEESASDLFFKYSVPLSKNRGKKKLWCLAWPYYHIIIHAMHVACDAISEKAADIQLDGIKTEVRKELINLFRIHSPFIPVGVESKITNTLDFFDHVNANEALNKKINDISVNIIERCLSVIRRK